MKYKLRYLIFFGIVATFYYNIHWLNENFTDGNLKEELVSFVRESSHDLKKNPILFIGILSHWKRWKRRDSIRDTWMTQCKNEVNCFFFTDYIGIGEKERIKIDNEITQNNDTIIMPFHDSFAFAARLLWILKWSSSRYNYQYFLRIDDDHFLCLERLVMELKMRQKTALYWGFVHCQPSVVRIDEAWLMLTRDLVLEVIKKENTTLLCHPYGDQAVALWINNSTYNVTYFMDNTRIIHKSAGHDPVFFTRDVCEKYLSLHGTYHNEMRQFWLIWYQLHRRLLKATPTYHIPDIQPFETLCPHSKILSTNAFHGEFRYEPRLCRSNPKWSITKTVYVAREEVGERYVSY